MTSFIDNLIVRAAQLIVENQELRQRLDALTAAQDTEPAVSDEAAPK